MVFLLFSLGDLIQTHDFKYYLYAPDSHLFSTPTSLELKYYISNCLLDTIFGTSNITHHRFSKTEFWLPPSQAWSSVFLIPVSLYPFFLVSWPKSHPSFYHMPRTSANSLRYVFIICGERIWLVATIFYQHLIQTPISSHLDYCNYFLFLPISHIPPPAAVFHPCNR